MNPLVKILSLTILCLFVSCTSKQKEKNPITSVDLEKNINNLQIVNLSDLATDVKYIALENIENLPLNSNSIIEISGNNILVTDRNYCLLYDSKGNFVSKIGNKGNGPGEYQFIVNIGLGSNKKQKIFIQSLYDLIEYNSDGSFQKRYSGILTNKKDYAFEKWHLLDDSLIFANIPNSTGVEQNKAMIINFYGKCKYLFKNYDTFLTDQPRRNLISEFAYIYKFNGALWFKQYFNDTLFLLNEDYHLIPKYVFKSGSLKIPVSDRLKFPIGDILWSHKTLFEVFQTKNFLFLKFLFGNNFPAKRLTPRPSPFPGQDDIWINTNYILGIFNKASGELTLCKPTSTDNPLFTSGIYNDFDCGPRFFPSAIVNDSTLLMTISPKELKDHIATDDFRKNSTKFPDKKKLLEDFAAGISVMDNSILMVVTFK